MFKNDANPDEGMQIDKEFLFGSKGPTNPEAAGEQANDFFRSSHPIAKASPGPSDLYGRGDREQELGNQDGTESLKEEENGAEGSEEANGEEPAASAEEEGGAEEVEDEEDQNGE
jgi:hypothetical protein